MNNIFRSVCIKCAGKVSEVIEVYKEDLPKLLLLNIVSYQCDRCDNTNFFKDMFYTEADAGDEISIKIVNTTQKRYNALRELEGY